MNLLRGEGGLIKVGHRGAPALAPENTIASFERAVAAGVDAIEFDVLDLDDGSIVLAHSDDLREVSHGAASGPVRSRTLAELRAVAPGLPTLEEALAFFADAPVALHVDLKLRAREDEVARALAARGLVERAVVSSAYIDSLLAAVRGCPELRLGFTYPEDRRGLSRHRALVPVVLGAVVAMRGALPRRVGKLVGRAGASALMLHHMVVSRRAVERAHELGVAVWTWTVDSRSQLARMEAAGVDAVITNDPRIFESSSLH